MSGSSGNSSAGSKGGRSPRNDNADVVARHGQGGAQPTGNTDASTHARGTTESKNRQTADPDAPTDES